MKTTRVRFGWKVLEVEDDPHFNDPHYEQECFRRLLMQRWDKDGSCYVDVGAHQGIYTSFFQALGGPPSCVAAFEPNPDNWRLLAGNLAPTAVQAPAAVYPYALGRAAGVGKLRCWRDRPGASGQGQFVIGDPCEHEHDTVLAALDDLKFPLRVALVKIDVEHWEFEVVAGAVQTILRDKPRLLVEVHSEAAARRLTDFCRARRFPFEVWQASAGGQVRDFLFVDTALTQPPG